MSNPLHDLWELDQKGDVNVIVWVLRCTAPITNSDTENQKIHDVLTKNREQLRNHLQMVIDGTLEEELHNEPTTYWENVIVELSDS